MDAAEISELVQLYQRTSSNLSYVRSYYPDPPLVAYLTRLVSSAGAVIYGTRPRTWRVAARFFTTTFPAAVYRARWFVLIAALLTVVPAVVVGVWIAHAPNALDAIAPAAARDAYVNGDFESYYESERASQFSSAVFTNNVQVAVMAFAGGVLLCVPTVYLLVFNGINVGFAGGMFAAYGEQAKFWGLIAPHGLLEISSIIIAGAAGLQIGWSFIAPGARTRAEAFKEEGRRIFTIVLGLVVSFGIAGFIEGFVTGQPWPTWFRVGIGVVVWLAFCTYLVVQGRAAHQAGYTGALSDYDDVGWAAKNRL